MTSCAAGILDGTLAPGPPIPSERTLSEELGVNRHAVREAVKRSSRRGSSGHARRRHPRARLARPRRARAARRPRRTRRCRGQLVLLRGIVEMRLIIGVDAARLCARPRPRPSAR